MATNTNMTGVMLPIHDCQYRLCMQFSAKAQISAKAETNLTKTYVVELIQIMFYKLEKLL